MAAISDYRKQTAGAVLFLLAIAWLLGISDNLFAHGGKTHGDEAFSSFQALEKATGLYDRLIASGKLSEEWETELKTVRIEVRNKGAGREYVVEFTKAEGNPQSVYFFFDYEGNYTGSNFTGK